MKRKAFNSLNEAALSVQLGEEGKKSEPKSDAIWSRKHNGFVSPKDFKKDIKDTHDKMKKQTESVDIPDMVLEYFDKYFGDELTEDTSDDDIMEAVTHLVLLTESVCEAVNNLQKDSVEHDGDDIQELKTSTLQNYLKKSIYKGRGADPNLGRKQRSSQMKAVDRLATRKTRMYQGNERGNEIK